jgi:hypothetical protein
MAYLIIKLTGADGGITFVQHVNVVELVKMVPVVCHTPNTKPLAEYAPADTVFPVVVVWFHMIVGSVILSPGEKGGGGIIPPRHTGQLQQGGGGFGLYHHTLLPLLSVTWILRGRG